MTSTRRRLVGRALPAAVLLAFAMGPAQAGPFNANTEFAIPGGGGNDNIATLKQVSGFTGNMALTESDGSYSPVGSSFNKEIKLSFKVDCPAGYHVYNAGFRVRGNDVFNYTVEPVSDGSLPSSQNSWEAAFFAIPWDLDRVVDVGADALAEAGNPAQLFVSLDEELDSRIEYYATCRIYDIDSGWLAVLYDSAQEGENLRPLTRVRYTYASGIAGLQGRPKGLKADRRRAHQPAAIKAPAKIRQPLVTEGTAGRGKTLSGLKLRKTR